MNTMNVKLCLFYMTVITRLQLRNSIYINIQVIQKCWKIMFTKFRRFSIVLGLGDIDKNHSIFRLNGNA